MPVNSFSPFLAPLRDVCPPPAIATVGVGKRMCAVEVSVRSSCLSRWLTEPDFPSLANGVGRRRSVLYASSTAVRKSIRSLCPPPCLRRPGPLLSDARGVGRYFTFAGRRVPFWSSPFQSRAVGVGRRSILSVPIPPGRPRSVRVRPLSASPEAASLHSFPSSL